MSIFAYIEDSTPGPFVHPPSLLTSLMIWRGYRCNTEGNLKLPSWVFFSDSPLCQVCTELTVLHNF